MGRRSHGFALITVLVAVTAVFAAAMSLAALSRAAVIESGALSRSLEREFGARTAAAQVVAGLVGESVTTEGSGGESGSGGSGGESVDTEGLPEMPEFLREFLGSAMDEPESEDDTTTAGAGGSRRSSERSVRYLSARGLPAGVVPVKVGETVYRVGLVDALGFINLNRAGFDELASLFEQAGAEPYAASGLAAELIDYRDEDGFVSPRGAEAADYTRRGLVIRDGDLGAPEELLYLPSMTLELFRAVRPLVTVSGDGKLHAMSTPEEVIAVLPGVGASAAKAIVSLREGGVLDAETLEGSLPLFETDLVSRFRFEPSPVIRVRVVAEGGGPRYVGLVVVTTDGLQWVSFEQE